MANGLIQAIPEVADMTDPAEIQAVTNLAYRLSRALIGNQLADRFELSEDPRHRNPVPLPDEDSAFARTLKGGQRMVRSGNFTQLLQISAYDDYGLNYELPDHEKHSMSSPW